MELKGENIMNDNLVTITLNSVIDMKNYDN